MVESSPWNKCLFDLIILNLLHSVACFVILF